MLVVLALAVAGYALGRRRAARGAAGGQAAAAEGEPPASRGDRGAALVSLLEPAVGAGFAVLLFAGLLSAEGHAGWPGWLAGLACFLLGYIGLGRLFARARERLRGGPAALIDLYAEGAALALAAAAILVPPVGLLAVAAFLLLAVRSGGEGTKKFAGLRVLR